jgi:hypothetical protein
VPQPSRRDIFRMAAAAAAMHSAVARAFPPRGSGIEAALMATQVALGLSAAPVRRISRASQSVAAGTTLPLLTINASGVVTTGSSSGGSGTSRPNVTAGPGYIASILIVQSDQQAGTSAASFSGTIASAVLTASGVTGTPSPGLLLQWSSISGPTSAVSI